MRNLQSPKMKVTIKESSIVRPSQQTSNRRLWLSNMDLMFPPFYISAAYLYKSDGSPNFMHTKLLQESLSNLLVAFYPLAGRLVVDENGRREVNCNGDGVLFVEAETDCPLADYADFTAFKHLLLPAIDPQKPFSSYPLLLLQVTRFSCGGVFLGYRMHHNVEDAEGTTHFFYSWAELTRGQPITVPPVFDRSFLQARQPPTPKFHHVEYDLPPTAEIQTDPEPFTSLIKIPIDFICALKSRLNKKNPHVKYSTFQILTAHLWRCTTKARNLNSDQVTTLRISVNCRNRLNPTLPKGYSGNAILYATTELLAGELLSEPFLKTIARIHNAIREMPDDYLRSSIDYIQKSNNDSNQLLQGGQKHQSIQLRRGTFFVNSWVTMPIFNADFGWGRPSNMVPQKLLEGMALFLPCFNGENDLPIVICLQDEHKKSFETLLYESDLISKM